MLIKGYVDRVVISCGTEVIARHPRSYEQDDFVFDPIHYLPLLERKTGALDQAAPLAGWDLPEEYRTLRQRGNPAFRPRTRTSYGSIPARAGEPTRPYRDQGHGWVYPRACGGTWTGVAEADHYQGLSPRVRGNLDGSGGS